MNARRTSVWWLILVTGALWFGVTTSSMAQEASPNPGQDKQKMIEGANADAASLRKSLKRQEEHRKTLLHPTLEQADNVISAYDNTIRDYTSELSRMQKELEKARANNDEEGVKWTLDRMGSHKLTVNVLKEGANHYRLARAKLVNSDTGLVADLIDVGDLSETVFAKKQMGTINKLKAELAKKEQEIQALEGVSTPTDNVAGGSADRGSSPI